MTHSSPLRIGLLGLGSVGSLLAYHWRDHSLYALPRDQQSPVIVQVQDQQHLWQQELPCWQGEPLDWLVVCTKAGDTLNALQAWQPHLSSVPELLLLQNGMGQQQQTADWLNQQKLSCRLWAGMSTEGAYREGDRIVYAGRGENLMGLWDGTNAGDTGLPAITTVTAIIPHLRTKLAVNAVINPLTGALRCRNGELLQQPDYHQRLLALSDEIAGLYAHLTWELPQPFRERVEQVASATAANRSSTLQDILQGRPTELAYICGYLLKVADSHDWPMPLTDALYQQLSS